MVIRMRRGIVLMCGIWLLLSAAGCRTNGSQELLERELRLMEDEIYHLEDDLDHFEAMLASCRRENAALRKQLAAGGTSEEPGFGGGARPPEIDLGPPDVTQPSNDFEQQGGEAPPFRPPSDASESAPEDNGSPGPDQQPPLLNPDEDDAPPQPPAETSLPKERRDRRVSFPRAETDAKSDAPSSLANRERTEENDGPTDTKQKQEDENRSGEAAIDDYMVARITLNRLLTGGVNQDDRPGDDGVMIVVEPRNAENQIINVPGELAVVVVDPNVREGDPRIARWDFSPDEVAERFRESLLAEGIHLEMPWPAVVPRHRRLHLHVRFVTADGKEFRADRPIFVDPPPPGGSRWQAAEHDKVDRQSQDTPPDEPSAPRLESSSSPADPEPTSTSQPDGPLPPAQLTAPQADRSGLPHAPAARPLETSALPRSGHRHERTANRDSRATSPTAVSAKSRSHAAGNASEQQSPRAARSSAPRGSADHNTTMPERAASDRTSAEHRDPEGGQRGTGDSSRERTRKKRRRPQWAPYR